MAELKTKSTDTEVQEFLASIPDEQKRKDSEDLVRLFSEVTGETATMWGSSIIGFGSYHFKYKSGREGDWMVTGFSPRKAQLTLYLMDGYDNQKDSLAKLGKCTTAKSCLYIKKLSDVDQTVLRDMIKKSIKHVTSKDFLL